MNEAIVDLEAVKAQTYAEAGIAELKALGRQVFVRTYPIPTATRSGLLWLPSTATEFFKGPAHKRMITGTVLAVGPKAKLGIQPGDVITFTRLFFAYYKKLSDGTYLGYIRETDVSGYADGAVVEGVDDAPPPRTR